MYKILIKNGCTLCSKLTNYFSKAKEINPNLNYQIINISLNEHKEKYYETYKFRVPVLLLNDDVLGDMLVNDKKIDEIYRKSLKN